MCVSVVSWSEVHSVLGWYTVHSVYNINKMRYTWVCSFLNSRLYLLANVCHFCPTHCPTHCPSPPHLQKRQGVIPPHIIGLISRVHSELLRHNVSVPFYGSPGSPYVPSYPVNPPLTPQPQRHYQQPGGRGGGEWVCPLYSAFQTVTSN